MSRRLMIFVPEINPNTFVFFYYEGTSGRSYSVRDYSREGPARLLRAERFLHRAEEIVSLARQPGSHMVPAERISTDDWRHWHQLTLELNRRHLGTDAPTSAPTPAPPASGTRAPIAAPIGVTRAPMPRTAPAANSGPAAKGSRYCLQRYVEHRPEDLRDLITCHSPSLSAFDAQRFEWKTPLAAEDYREYQDDFLRPLGLQQYEDQLAEFWPRGGPVWDSLALLTASSDQGVLLVEAKAHPGETLSSCKASGESLKRIRESLERVRHHMGTGPADWLNGSYQLANRLAFLYFMNEVIDVPTWLALINFIGDESHKPTSLGDWRLHQQNLFRSLGLHPGCRLLDRIISLHTVPIS
jgi:hypothetical protein